MKKLSLLLLSLCCTYTYAQNSPQRVYKSTSIYPEGRLEVSVLGFGTKYFGEFTDNSYGYAGGVSSRYTFPFLPEFSLGARFTTGSLSYSRRFKARYAGSFEEQFPKKHFGTAPEMRTTTFTELDLLAYINLFPRKELNYYGFAGLSAVNYNPQDIEEDPIGSNGRRTYYSQFTVDKANIDFHPIIGFGADYFPEKTFSIGIQSAFHVLNTDYVDGFASRDDDSKLPTLSDAYAEIGLKGSYYFFTDPDIDHDGLANSDEEKIGTNPYDPDTDEDGVTDFDEEKIYHSNPLVADTDDDGLGDSEEIFTFHSNPSQKDSDGDGIADFDEIRLYRTNPNVADTDNDRLSDLAELKKGSNALNGDSDSDGIGDYDDECPNIFGVKERNGCPEPPYPPAQHLYTGAVQPEKEKHDTVYIIREVANLKEKEIYTFYGVNFETSSAEIRVESEIILDDVVKWLKAHPEYIVEIQGHTDSDGSELSNQKLSEARAISVREYLIRNGIDAGRLSAVGFGEYRPVVSNDSAKDKARNRRIEFHVTHDNTTAKH